MTSVRQGLTPSEYFALRAPYTPARPKVIFVLESPPVSGEYFYNPAGRLKESLFRAMMHDVLEIAPETKAQGLGEFAARGFLLIDATYTPVNGYREGPVRDKIVVDGFHFLVEELQKYARAETRVILVKKNVCNLLARRLKDLNRFHILNSEDIIPFPGSGQQARFREIIRHTLGLGLQHDASF
jgi:hypothetical protein